jgi:hypothetical protein
MAQRSRGQGAQEPREPRPHDRTTRRGCQRRRSSRSRFKSYRRGQRPPLSAHRPHVDDAAGEPIREAPDRPVAGAPGVREADSTTRLQQKSSQMGADARRDQADDGPAARGPRRPRTSIRRCEAPWPGGQLDAWDGRSRSSIALHPCAPRRRPRGNHGRRSSAAQAGRR